MDGMPATICDTLNCSDYDSALSMITTLSGDQANLMKLKEDLDAEKKLSSKLKNDVAKLENDQTRFLRRNANLEAQLLSKDEEMKK